MERGLGGEVPLRNRVDPFGNIHAVPERGTMFGNRGGCMHTPDQRLHGRPWTNERWICCVLEFKGRRRKLMQPGLYTELFFLDEATAFAAGHRPCMECRRPDAKRFIEAWERGNLPPSERIRSISEIDACAHQERVDAKTHAQLTQPARLAELPDGAMVTFEPTQSNPLLVWRGQLLPWSFGGYGRASDATADVATLLTPPSFVASFREGYLPSVHPTAR